MFLLFMVPRTDGEDKNLSAGGGVPNFVLILCVVHIVTRPGRAPLLIGQLGGILVHDSEV